MRLRRIFQVFTIGSAVALTSLAATPALAGEGHHHPSPQPGAPPPAGPDLRPEWRGDARPPAPPQAFAPPGREEWLAECRRRLSRRDDGLGGAVIGGVLGGLAGNRIAGRGHRTVGTVAGAAVGAVAGAAIDRAEDGGRAKDECEAYFDDYYAYYARGYGYGPGQGQAYGYAQSGYVPAGGCCYGAPIMMVPVMMVRKSAPECTETVETIYEDVPARRRIYRAPRRVPDKRIRVAPDKRVRTN